MTIAAVQALGLEGTEVLLAYAFGVGPDSDHLVKAPLYIQETQVQKGASLPLAYKSTGTCFPYLDTSIFCVPPDAGASHLLLVPCSP